MTIIAISAVSSLFRLALAITAPVLSIDPPIHAPIIVLSTSSRGNVGMHGMVKILMTAIRLVSASFCTFTQSPTVIAALEPQILTPAAVTKAYYLFILSANIPIENISGKISNVSTQLTISAFPPTTPSPLKLTANKTILIFIKNSKS